jgi:hypothetical protein
MKLEYDFFSSPSKAGDSSYIISAVSFDLIQYGVFRVKIVLLHPKSQDRDILSSLAQARLLALASKSTRSKEPCLTLSNLENK